METGLDPLELDAIATLEQQLPRAAGETVRAAADAGGFGQDELAVAFLLVAGAEAAAALILDDAQEAGLGEHVALQGRLPAGHAEVIAQNRRCRNCCGRGCGCLRGGWFDDWLGCYWLGSYWLGSWRCCGGADGRCSRLCWRIGRYAGWRRSRGRCVVSQGRRRCAGRGALRHLGNPGAALAGGALGLQLAVLVEALPAQAFSLWALAGEQSAQFWQQALEGVLIGRAAEGEAHVQGAAATGLAAGMVDEYFDIFRLRIGQPVTVIGRLRDHAQRHEAEDCKVLHVHIPVRSVPTHHRRPGRPERFAGRWRPCWSCCN